MTDNELFRILLLIIRDGLAVDGINDVTVLQAFNPTQQGVLTSPAVYLSKLYDYRYGWLYRDQSNVPAGIQCEQTQQVETTFKISALVIQNPLTPNQYTASDLVNKVTMILGSIENVEYLATLGLGILVIKQVGNDYDVDDRDQFEASPAFNLTISHKNTRTILVPRVQSVESVIGRV